jgi:hypothetical protein
MVDDGAGDPGFGVTFTGAVLVGEVGVDFDVFYEAV